MNWWLLATFLIALGVPALIVLALERIRREWVGLVVLLSGIVLGAFAAVGCLGFALDLWA